MAEAAVAVSTAVVAGAVFTEAVEATVEAADITARPAAAATAAVGIAAPMAVVEITIRCLLAALIPLDALAIPTVRPVIEDTRRATVATVQQAVVRA